MDSSHSFLTIASSFLFTLLNSFFVWLSVLIPIFSPPLGRLWRFRQSSWFNNFWGGHSNVVRLWQSDSATWVGETLRATKKHLRSDSSIQRCDYFAPKACRVKSQLAVQQGTHWRDRLHFKESRIFKRTIKSQCSSSARACRDLSTIFGKQFDLTFEPSVHLINI